MNFKLIRCRRKSISICIFEDNVVTVRCPFTMSAECVKEFVDSKSSWIEKITNENSARYALHKQILDYNEVLINGNRVPVVYSDKNYIAETAVYVTNESCLKKLFI